MSKFAVNDWVKIIPSPDTKSDVWTASHNKFCDKIGQIIDINTDDPEMIIFRVSVFFNYKKLSLHGEHSAWFQENHVIKSSKWEADRIITLNEEYEKYMRTESNLKRRRDEILKNIFTEPERVKQAAVENKHLDGWVFGDDWYMKDMEHD
jgi:Txe/YoeB family toxin of Txe-Axe toxin-antitoxin module